MLTFRFWVARMLTKKNVSMLPLCIVREVIIKTRGEGHLIICISVIYKGNLLQYKLIYSSCMYIVLKREPEYRYPLYFEKSSRFRHADPCCLDLLMRQCSELLAGQISKYPRIHPLI
jgi:hypothetical protein